MMSYEPNERVNGYEPDDPPQGEHWCSECSAWDEECSCSEATCEEEEQEEKEAWRKDLEEPPPMIPWP